MANQFAAPPINPVISVAPLTTPAPGRDAANIPAELAKLPAGTVVEGFVINRDAQSNPILRTPIGDLLIKSDIFLKTGSEVVFRVDTTLASHARILTINGLTPTDYAAQQTRNPTADSIEPSPLPSAEPLPETAVPVGSQPAAPPPQPLQAVLLTPLAAGKPNAAVIAGDLPVLVAAELPATLKQLQAGTPLKLTLLKVELPLPSTTAQAVAGPFTPAEEPLPPTPGLPASAPPLSPSGSQPATLPEASLTARVLAQPVMASRIETSPPPLFAPIPAAANATEILPAAVAVSPFPQPLAAQPPIIPASAPNLPPIATAPLPVTAIPTLPATAATTPPLAVQEILPSAPPAMTLPQAMLPPLPVTPAVANQTLVPASSERTAPSLPATVPPTTASKPLATMPSPPVIARGVPLVVIGRAADGATILHSPMGTIKTYLAQPLPTGTKLTAEVEPQSITDAPPPDATPLPGPMEEITSLARDWKTLGDTVQALQANNPPLAQLIMQQVPALGSGLSSGLLFFLAAVKNGDPRQWLGGRAMNQLELELPALAAKLHQDMTQLQQFFNEAPKGNWSAVMLPMLHDGQLEHARLFFRQDEERAGKGGKGGRNHRFIVEVDLSHIGDLQFDGFVRSVERKRQFDLIIRSARVLPAQVAGDIRNLFEDAIKTSGYNGYLSFQQGSQHFVRPLAGLKAAATDGDTNTILA